MLNPMSDKRLKTKLHQKQCFFVAVAGGLLTNCADSKVSGKSQHLQVAVCFFEVYTKEPALIYQISMKGTFSCHPRRPSFP